MFSKGAPPPGKKSEATKGDPSKTDNPHFFTGIPHSRISLIKPPLGLFLKWPEYQSWPFLGNRNNTLGCQSLPCTKRKKFAYRYALEVHSLAKCQSKNSITFAHIYKRTGQKLPAVKSDHAQNFITVLKEAFSFTILM